MSCVCRSDETVHSSGDVMQQQKKTRLEYSFILKAPTVFLKHPATYKLPLHFYLESADSQR